MPKLMRESFRSRLAKTPLLGTFVKMSSPEIIEILGFAGFDFVIADMEHTSLDLAVVEQIARVADVHGMDVIVRVPDLSPHYISRALDVGVSGIQVPQIENETQLEAVVQRVKYPPLGKRGLTYAHRAAEYGFADTNTYMEQANEATAVIAHVETESAYRDVDRLAAVEGLDVLFIGPTDLSVALRTQNSNYLNGDLADPTQRMIAAAEATGKQVGIVVSNDEEYQFAVEHGIRYIVWGSDVALFKGAATAVRNRLRAPIT